MKNDQKIRDNGLSKSDYIVWTRMQSEAGQNLSDIVDRKEREREAGKGIFFWGVGNAPSKMINALARTKVDISVVFSRMKSPPKDVDQKPATIVLWKNFIDCEGRLRELPPHTLITSRGETKSRRKRVHYALQCFSAKPLKIAENGKTFDPLIFRNAGGTGAPVGNSQVTSLLLPAENAKFDCNSAYSVNMQSTLTGSYWVKLVDPIPLPLGTSQLVDCSSVDREDWLTYVQEIRLAAGTSSLERDTPLLL